MTQTAPTTPVPTAQSLEPLERLGLRDQLQDLWRDKVAQITALAVRFHSLEPDTGRIDEPALVASCVDHVQLDLTEIEAAMRRMDVGRYGNCERCSGSIPFDELTAQPYRRRCSACQGGAR